MHKLNNKVSKLVKSLEDRQNELHQGKIDLDIAYRQFEDKDDSENISFE